MVMAGRRVTVMPTNRAMITVCSLLCALLTSCSKSRPPSRIDATQAGAGAAMNGASSAAGAGAKSAAGASASSAAGASGTASDAGRAAGAPAAAGSAEAGGSGGMEAPSSGCTGPWYKCGGVCPAQLILQGATRNLGECIGDCWFDLNLSTAVVLDVGSCAEVHASLTVQNTDGSRRTYEGVLTEAAWERAMSLSIDIAAERAAIRAVSGCPDCADGGSAAIVIQGVDQLSETFTYEYDNPPAALRAADEFMQALIDELLACEGALLESCMLMPATDVDVDPGPPACTFAYNSMTSAVSCSMPLDVERPCAVAVGCLCQSGILDANSTDIDTCVESWLTPRGAVTFTDVCTQGQTDLTGTLSSALTSFASAYGDTVMTETDCDVVSAYY
jgi:hypothetical protein